VPEHVAVARLRHGQGRRPVAGQRSGAHTSAQPSGRLGRTLGDGTRLVVLYGRDEDKVLAEIDRLAFDKP
jgi:hypothetical protein